MLKKSNIIFIKRISHSGIRRKKSEEKINKIIDLVISSNKNTLEQYKILATLLATANGAGAIALINSDVSLYINAIFIFSFSMLSSLCMLVLSFISSYTINNKFKEYINNEELNIDTIIVNYISKGRTMYILMLASFAISSVGFESGILFALNKHNFNIFLLFN